MIENKQLTSIKQNLSYVKNCFEAGTHQEQKPILSVLLAEVYDAVKSFDVEYKVPVSVHREHVQTFINLATQEKYRLLSDVQELQSELHKKNTNRSLQLVKNMLVTDLYRNKVRKSLDKFIPSTPARYGSSMKETI
ncbi:hypothetical protein ACFW35_18320 [Fictibacillus sp. NPDC058756]|uniref:hypothetical protein n=1 Tax=Fictibacillus sp. NPDC058756 TaxID=3346625 RepID=UPI0036856E49